MTAPTRERKTGRGVWFHALLILGLAGAGLVASSVLIWFYLISGTNREHQAALAAGAADHYAAALDARIMELEAQLGAIASAPATAATLASYDPARLQAAGRELTRLLPHADRIALIPKGTAEVDLNAKVPITFAALDVIRRAESEPFVGPEGIKLDSQRSRFYAARPVTREGGVAGVLFVAMAADYFLTALDAFEASIGRVTLEQTFAGTEPVALLQRGDAGAGALPSERLRRELRVPHWQLVLEPNPAASPALADGANLLTALAVAAGFLLAAVLLGFSSLARNLQHDVNVLLEQVGNRLRGQRQQPHRYKLAVFHDLAREIVRMARPSKDPAGPEEPPGIEPAGPRIETPRRAAAQAEGQEEQPLDDLLNDDDPGTRRRNRPARADDFLEVNPTGSEGDNFGIQVTEDTSPSALGLELEPEIFRSYDIRGITTRNLTEEVVYWIGRSFAAEALDLSQGRVAVGRDGRHSSLPLRNALVRGLTEGGVDVIDVGQVPTPLLYFATVALDTGTGIMITGSHNPPEYNGLKMMIGGETLAEGRIQTLRARIEENRLSAGAGDVEQIDITDHYLDRVSEDVVVAQPLKVVVDCGNGVAGDIAPTLLSRLGCDVVPLYCDVDGDFPNHHPDPAEPANLEDLITVVAAEGADLGLAFDGDGDRLGVVTGRGEIIWPDKLLMLYAQDIVGRNPGADIIYDVKCSRHLNSLISDMGGRPIMWKTGHSHMKAKLKQTGALLAGEFSGHICFGERWNGFDDALYAAARLLEILAASDQSADELFSQFPVTYSTPELKIQTTEQAKFDVMKRLADDGDFGAGTLTTIDGLRVDYPDGWGLIRPSNTSPVLSLRFEADGQESLTRIQDLFQAQLTAIDPGLRFR